MDELKLNIKITHPGFIFPRKSHLSDACYDVYAIDDGIWDDTESYITYDLGFAIELPEDSHAELYARSSIYKTSYMLNNGVAIIDSGYTGSWKCVFRRIPRIELYSNGNGIGNDIKQFEVIGYEKGERIAQFKIVKNSPNIEFRIVDEIRQTDRGSGGFGSSGS